MQVSFVDRTEIPQCGHGSLKKGKSFQEILGFLNNKVEGLKLLHG